MGKWHTGKKYWQRLICLHSANMADGEEDFSSLPLVDRFSHKVRHSATCYLLATRLMFRVIITGLES
jgi:hypothetical protein